MASSAPSWPTRVMQTVLALLVAVGLALGAIVALFAYSGMSHTDARATSPDGALEARAERQGGSMQYPRTSLYVSRHRSWFAPAAPDCLVTYWSDKGSGRERGNADRAVALRWRGDRALLVEADVTVAAPSGYRCGIRLSTAGGEHAMIWLKVATLIFLALGAWRSFKAMGAPVRFEGRRYYRQADGSYRRWFGGRARRPRDIGLSE